MHSSLSSRVSGYQTSSRRHQPLSRRPHSSYRDWTLRRRSRRPGVLVEQTIEVGVTASEDKTREPATSARTRLGPRAMALNNKRRRRVLPRRASCLRNQHSRTTRTTADLKVGTTTDVIQPAGILTRQGIYAALLMCVSRRERLRQRMLSCRCHRNCVRRAWLSRLAQIPAPTFFRAAREDPGIYGVNRHRNTGPGTQIRLATFRL
jgi:hypothetical protein